VRASCPLIIKDGQDAHPTKLGNLFFGVPLKFTTLFDEYSKNTKFFRSAHTKTTETLKRDKKRFFFFYP
jgi:hypothetical protein